MNHNLDTMLWGTRIFISALFIWFVLAWLLGPLAAAHITVFALLLTGGAVTAWTMWDGVRALRKKFAPSKRRPSVELERHADAIIALGAELGITNLRVFGSCVSGTDDADSDINLIGEVGEGRGYFEIGAFVGAVEEVTGFTVDFVIDGAERPAFLDEEEMALL